MFVRVEPTGCCERKGLVQVRFCMYLDESDYGYEKHHVQVPIIPEEGYPGEVGNRRQPTDIEDYDAWASSLPKVWQTNPFHNHLIYVEPDTTDDEIMNMGEAFLEEAYIKWSCNEKLDLKNPSVAFYTSVDKTRQKAIDAKVTHLKENVLERII